MFLPAADSFQSGKLFDVDVERDWYRQSPISWLIFWKMNKLCGMRSSNAFQKIYRFCILEFFLSLKSKIAVSPEFLSKVSMATTIIRSKPLNFWLKLTAFCRTSKNCPVVAHKIPLNLILKIWTLCKNNLGNCIWIERHLICWTTLSPHFLAMSNLC